MKKFKELLFLSNIARLTTAKINNNYVPILSKFKTFDKLLDFLRKDYSEDKLEKALEKTEKNIKQLDEFNGLSILTIVDKKYPEKLKDLGTAAPLFLYTMGNVDCLKQPSVSVVGTTKPDLITQNFEYKFTREVIKETERVIVSGLALGCDKIAHTVAVDADEKTVAVLPCGINKIELDISKRLAGGILESDGCLISVFPPNVAVSDRNFTQRNEYVAALSDCTVAFQCFANSGTLETVNFAKKYGRKIATFLPKDTDGADFTGNEYILNNKYNAFRINDLEDLNGFIDFLNTEIKERKLVYTTKNKKEFTLKINPDGQCTFEFDYI